MNAEQKRLAREIFADALEKGGPEERSAFVEQACGPDAELRQLVEALLQAHEHGGELPGRSMLAAAEQGTGEGPGTVIGRYKLLQEIGEGAFGVVYMAEQTEPVHRKVALKIIKAGMDTRAVIARFEAERQALALMDHPNIAKILDAGVTGAPDSPPTDHRSLITDSPPLAPRPSPLAPSARPYFVMELVKGLPITAYADQYNLSIEERLRLFMQVCHGVQHAHQKGIIHRDLKPSNILVTLLDGEAVPKIIDFGVAKALGHKLTDKTLFTAFEQLIGTPAYMSPEQAELSGVDIDTRSDIYALGVLLYELLTGLTPFDKETLRQAALDEIRRIIRETEPPKPSTRLTELARRLKAEGSSQSSVVSGQRWKEVRGDLDWIVMKALEKDRRRRYETAGALTEDLQRHLGHEPVRARPPSAAYRARKFVRRHRTGVALAASVTVALIAGLLASLIGFREARRERDRAEAQTAKSRQVARFLQDMLAGVGPAVARGRDTAMLREILDQTAERVGKDLNNQPEVKAELQYAMGRVYGALGQFDRGEALHREALAIRRELHGNEDADVAASLYELASLIESSYRPAEAEPLYREALAIRRKLHGDEHLDVAAALNGLASALQFQGNSDEAKYDEAAAVFREALAMRRRLLGDEHPDITTSLNGLAYTIALMGQFEEGERLGREALAMRRKLFTTDHPDVAQSISGLAYILCCQRKWAEAETLYQEVVEMRRRVLGKEHGYVYMMLAMLGNVLVQQGKLAEAEATFREVLEAEGNIPKTAPRRQAVRLSGAGLAEVLSRQGRLAELLTLDLDDEVLNGIARGLATSGMRDGRIAVAIAEKAAVMTSRTNPPVLDTLAAAYAGAGEFTNAVNVQKEAIALLKSEEERKHCESRLRLYESGIPYREHQLLANQADRLLCEGRFAEAEPLARECLAAREREIPDQYRTFNARSLLGGSLLGQKKYAEAEPLLLSGYEGLEKRAMTNRWRLYRREALQRLAQLYEATDRPAQAAECKQKLAELEKALSATNPAAPPR